MTVYRTNVKVPRIGPLGGGEWELTGLTAVTVLFGKNGSGKSVLLRNWRDQNVAGAHYVAPERTGEISFNPNLMQQQLEAQGRRETSTRNYAPDYRAQVVSRIQTYFLRRGEIRQGTPPGNPAELEEFLSQLIPDFSISVQARNPPYRIIRLSNNEAVGGVDALSSGEAQLVTVALDVLTMAAIWELDEKHERILLIDEPDAHIHPDLQIRFADFLVGVARRFELQVVVATHSTTLLSALGQFGAGDTSVIYLDRRGTQFATQKFDRVHKELATCLGGHALMGPLFAAPLLIVEGDDDYRIWSQVPRHHIINLAVLPANGDEIHRYQGLLERILGSLREPGSGILGYALLDGDKALPQASPQQPQDFVRYLRLNCHEAENLFIADEVLADFGITWADACLRLAEKATDHGNKAERLKNAAQWDRRSVDLKEIIEEVSRILDSKNVHWTIRVGTRVGRARPSGQLADYLGQDVLSALWPAPTAA